MTTDTETPAPLTLQELTDAELANEPEEGEREFKRIPEDLELVAELRGVQLRTMPFNEKIDGVDTGEKAKRYEFEFKIVEEGEYKNFRVWGETFPEFKRSARCRLYQWVQELLGQEIPPNFTLDWDHLIGLRARIKIGLRTWENDKGKGSKNYVKWVSRLRGDEDAAVGTIAEFRAQNTTGTSSWDDEEPF